MVVIVRLMTADLVTDALEMATLASPPTRSRVIAYSMSAVNTRRSPTRRRQLTSISAKMLAKKFGEKRRHEPIPGGLTRHITPTRGHYLSRGGRPRSDL
jgi:hypothetical protein